MSTYSGGAILHYIIFKEMFKLKYNKLEMLTEDNKILELTKEYIKMGDKVNLEVFKELGEEINEFSNIAMSVFGTLDYLAELRNFDSVYNGYKYIIIGTSIYISINNDLVLCLEQVERELILYNINKCKVYKDINKIKKYIPNLNLIGSIINNIDTHFSEYNIELDSGELLKIRIQNNKYYIAIASSPFIPLADVSQAIKLINKGDSSTQHQRNRTLSKRERLGLR